MRCVRIDDCQHLADDPWDEVIQNLDCERALQQLSEAERYTLQQWLESSESPTPEVESILNRLRELLQ